MKIAVIGATGMAGSAIYKEALQRGHDVTAIGRSAAKAREKLGAGARVLEKDAFALTREELAVFDVIVNSYATAPDLAHLHVDLAARLVALLRGTDKPRLVFILGAGSLLAGPDKHLFVEDIKHIPGSDAWFNIPVQQLKQLKFLREVENVNWTGISPSARFEPGSDKGHKLGGDELLVSGDGQSHVTSGTMAVAVLNEIENPAYVRQRFTVADL